MREFRILFCEFPRRQAGLDGRSHEWPDAILHMYEKEKELDDARAIQEELLPGEIMQMAGYEIACAWQSARGVGGDYYDLIPLY